MNKKISLPAFASIISVFFTRAALCAPELFAAPPSVHGREVKIAADDPAGILFGASGFTRYAKLESLYRRGTLPAREELSGWHAGRCYEEQDRDKPFPSILAGLNLGQDGPLFSDEFKVISLMSYGDGDGFDDPNGWKFSRHESVVKSMYSDATNMQVKDGAYASRHRLSSLYYPILADATLEYRVRKVEPYLIVQYTFAAFPRWIPEERQWLRKALKPGQVLDYCYYFKKLKN